ncbi:hypothetical protein, partial [Microcoleus sp. S13_C5]|uniref:hypothetical protein n=1 Tax=Microcoleus sp. S13_C5 TaxID=3055411 RepID=UPI002FCE8106
YVNATFSLVVFLSSTIYTKLDELTLTSIPGFTSCPAFNLIRTVSKVGVSRSEITVPIGGVLTLIFKHLD